MKHFCLFYSQSFHLILQQDLTIAAQLIRFAIDITLIAAVMHQTGMFPTMAQLKGMTQLMDGLLDNAAEKRFLRVQGIVSLIKPNGGYNAGLTAQLGFAVNMRQNGDEQIHLGNGQNLEGVDRGLQGELVQNGGGMVLIAIWVKRKLKVIQQRQDFG